MAGPSNKVTVAAISSGGGFFGDLFDVRKPQVLTPSQALAKTVYDVYGPEGESDEEAAGYIAAPTHRFTITQGEPGKHLAPKDKKTAFKNWQRPLQWRKLLNPLKAFEFIPTFFLNEIDSLLQADKWWNAGKNAVALESRDDASDPLVANADAPVKLYTWRAIPRALFRLPLSAIIAVTKIFTSPINTVWRPMTWFFREHPYLATALLLLTVGAIVTLGLSTAGVGALAPLVPAIPVLVPLLGKATALLVTNALLAAAPLAVPLAVKAWKGFSDAMRLRGWKPFMDAVEGLFAGPFTGTTSDVTSHSQRVHNTPAYEIVRKQRPLFLTDFVSPKEHYVHLATGAKQRRGLVSVVTGPLFGPKYQYDLSVSHRGGHSLGPSAQQVAFAQQFNQIKAVRVTGTDIHTGLPNYEDVVATDGVSDPLVSHVLISRDNLVVDGRPSEIVVPVTDVYSADGIALSQVGANLLQTMKICSNTTFQRFIAANAVQAPAASSSSSAGDDVETRRQAFADSLMIVEAVRCDNADDERGDYVTGTADPETPVQVIYLSDGQSKGNKLRIQASNFEITTKRQFDEFMDDESKGGPLARIKASEAFQNALAEIVPDTTSTYQP